MTYDLVAIGSDPGDYSAITCALSGAPVGMKVAVLEKRATHGGHRRASMWK